MSTEVGKWDKVMSVALSVLFAHFLRFLWRYERNIIILPQIKRI